MSETKTVRLHLGCGHHRLRGFVHVDMQPYPHVDHVAGVDRLPMFEDGSVELIYASHILEYFDEVEVLHVLADWHRVLVPGGLLRVAVPDFQSLVEVYSKTGAISQVVGPLYGRMVSSGQYIYHRSVWDFQSLSTVLRCIGFRGIEQVSDPWYPKLDDCSNATTRTPDGDVDISLNMQAVKA